MTDTTLADAAAVTPSTSTGPRVAFCGPSGVYGITSRRCAGCQAKGEHISQWQGPWYGYNHHCLSCGVTDSDGSLTPLTEDNEPHWLAVAERSVLPAELFDRYVAADERMNTSALNQTSVAERYSAAQLAIVAAEAAAFHAAADIREAEHERGTR